MLTKSRNVEPPAAIASASTLFYFVQSFAYRAMEMRSRACHRLISPEGELLLALPKSNQKAGPAARLIFQCSRFYVNECGMRQRHTNASLSLRRVCADDAFTTAQRSALRGEQKELPCDACICAT